MGDILVTVAGTVATTLQTTMTRGGRVATFRMASNVRRFDRNRGGWYDAETNFVTVTCWRQLAENVLSSIAKGEPVVAFGRMRVRPWKNEDREGTTVEIEAFAIGHDLSRGTTTFRRNQAEPAEPISDASQVEALHRQIESENDLLPGGITVPAQAVASAGQVNPAGAHATATVERPAAVERPGAVERPATAVELPAVANLPAMAWPMPDDPIPAGVPAPTPVPAADAVPERRGAGRGSRTAGTGDASRAESTDTAGRAA